MVLADRLRGLGRGAHLPDELPVDACAIARNAGADVLGHLVAAVADQQIRRMFAPVHCATPPRSAARKLASPLRPPSSVRTDETEYGSGSPSGIAFSAWPSITMRQAAS